MLVTNLLTEGRGMWQFTAGDAVRLLSEAIGRPDRRGADQHRAGRPAEVLERYRAEHKAPLEIGDIPAYCEVVTGEFWCRDIARHDRRRLAQAVWAVLARAA